MSTRDRAVILGDIALPEGWGWSTLGDVSEKPQYGWTTKANHDTGKLKLLRTTDITSGSVDWSTVPFCTDEPEDVEKYLVQSGDVLISRAGSVGVSFLINEPERAVFASYLIRFRPKSGIETKYFYYYLKSPSYWGAIGASKSGIAVPNVNASKLAQVPIPVAPLNQQKRIVAEIEKQFSRLDEAVANLKRVKANLKRYKAAVLKAAVEGRLVKTEAELARREGRSYETGRQLLQHILEARRSQWKGKGKYKEPATPDATNLPELPEGWVVASMEQLTSSERVICYGILMPKENVPGGVLYVKVRDMKGDKVDMASLQRTSPEIAGKYARASLKTGDLLLAIRGTYGRIAEVPPELDGGNITQDTARLAVSPLTDSNYVAWFLRSLDAQNYFKKVARGVAVKGVNIADVRVCPIFLPSLREQRRIVVEVDRRLSLVHEVEGQVDANLKRAERLRQSILGAAFSGKVLSGILGPAAEVLQTQVHTA